MKIPANPDPELANKFYDLYMDGHWDRVSSPNIRHMYVILLPHTPRTAKPIVYYFYAVADYIVHSYSVTKLDKWDENRRLNMKIATVPAEELEGDVPVGEAGIWIREAHRKMQNDGFRPDKKALEMSEGICKAVGME